MAHVHMHPKMNHQSRLNLAKRLGMRLRWDGQQWLMETPHHKQLQSNAGVVRMPRYRHQLGPDYDPEPPRPAA